MHSKSNKFDFLIVGLGNPGDEYAHTLHNAGFDVVDLIAEVFKCNYWKNGCGAIFAETKSKLGNNVVLAKPQSFMNSSGGPVSSLLKKYSLKVDNLIVIHDDLDLEPGTIRVKLGGSAGGHNGVASIINKIGSNNFIHIKVGVGHPVGNKTVIDWVLSKPIKKDALAIEEAKDRAKRACIDLLCSSVSKVQNEYN